MDKVRKIGNWIWLNKERIVLVVLIVVLCYQVYQIVFPTQMTFAQPLPPRKPNLESLEPEVKPPMDFRQLPRPRLGNYALLYRRNPFWGHSGGGTTTGTTEVTPETLNISLLDIKELGGRVRARLKTSTASKWYDEGEQFEQFQLESIDLDNGEVSIFAEKYGQYVTVKLQQ